MFVYKVPRAVYIQGTYMYYTKFNDIPLHGMYFCVTMCPLHEHNRCIGVCVGVCIGYASGMHRACISHSTGHLTRDILLFVSFVQS